METIWDIWARRNIGNKLFVHFYTLAIFVAPCVFALSKISWMKQDFVAMFAAFLVMYGYALSMRFVPTNSIEAIKNLAIPNIFSLVICFIFFIGNFSAAFEAQGFITLAGILLPSSYVFWRYLMFGTKPVHIPRSRSQSKNAGAALLFGLLLPAAAITSIIYAFIRLTESSSLMLNIIGGAYTFASIAMIAKSHADQMISMIKSTPAYQIKPE